MAYYFPPCRKRLPYVRPRGTLMTVEAMKYGTECTIEKRTITDPQGVVHEVTFLESAVIDDPEEISITMDSTFFTFDSTEITMDAT